MCLSVSVLCPVLTCRGTYLEYYSEGKEGSTRPALCGRFPVHDTIVALGLCAKGPVLLTLSGEVVVVVHSPGRGYTRWASGSLPASVRDGVKSCPDQCLISVCDQAAQATVVVGASMYVADLSFTFKTRRVSLVPVPTLVGVVFGTVGRILSHTYCFRLPPPVSLPGEQGIYDTQVGGKAPDPGWVHRILVRIDRATPSDRPLLLECVSASTDVTPQKGEGGEDAAPPNIWHECPDVPCPPSAISPLACLASDPEGRLVSVWGTHVTIGPRAPQARDQPDDNKHRVMGDDSVDLRRCDVTDTGAVVTSVNRSVYGVGVVMSDGSAWVCRYGPPHLGHVVTTLPHLDVPVAVHVGREGVAVATLSPAGTVYITRDGDVTSLSPHSPSLAPLSSLLPVHTDRQAARDACYGYVRSGDCRSESRPIPSRHNTDTHTETDTATPPPVCLPGVVAVGGGRQTARVLRPSLMLDKVSPCPFPSLRPMLPGSGGVQGWGCVVGATQGGSTDTTDSRGISAGLVQMGGTYGPGPQVSVRNLGVAAETLVGAGPISVDGTLLVCTESGISLLPPQAYTPSSVSSVSSAEVSTEMSCPEGAVSQLDSSPDSSVPTGTHLLSYHDDHQTPLCSPSEADRFISVAICQGWALAVSEGGKAHAVCVASAGATGSSPACAVYRLPCSTPHVPHVPVTDTGCRVCCALCTHPSHPGAALALVVWEGSVCVLDLCHDHGSVAVTQMGPTDSVDTDRWDVQLDTLAGVDPLCCSIGYLSDTHSCDTHSCDTHSCDTHSCAAETCGCQGLLVISVLGQGGELRLLYVRLKDPADSVPVSPSAAGLGSGTDRGGCQDSVPPPTLDTLDTPTATLHRCRVGGPGADVSLSPPMPLTHRDWGYTSALVVGSHPPVAVLLSPGTVPRVCALLAGQTVGDTRGPVAPIAGGPLSCCVSDTGCSTNECVCVMAQDGVYSLCPQTPRLRQVHTLGTAPDPPCDPHPDAASGSAGSGSRCVVGVAHAVCQGEGEGAALDTSGAECTIGKQGTQHVEDAWWPEGEGESGSGETEQGWVVVAYDTPCLQIHSDSTLDPTPASTTPLDQPPLCVCACALSQHPVVYQPMIAKPESAVPATGDTCDTSTASDPVSLAPVLLGMGTVWLAVALAGAAPSIRLYSFGLDGTLHLGPSVTLPAASVPLCMCGYMGRIAVGVPGAVLVLGLETGATGSSGCPGGQGGGECPLSLCVQQRLPLSVLPVQLTCTSQGLFVCDRASGCTLLRPNHSNTPDTPGASESMGPGPESIPDGYLPPPGYLPLHLAGAAMRVVPGLCSCAMQDRTQTQTSHGACDPAPGDPKDTPCKCKDEASAEDRQRDMGVVMVGDAHGQISVAHTGAVAVAASGGGDTGTGTGTEQAKAKDKDKTLHRNQVPLSVGPYLGGQAILSMCPCPPSLSPSLSPSAQGTHPTYPTYPAYLVASAGGQIRLLCPVSPPTGATLSHLCASMASLYDAPHLPPCLRSDLSPLSSTSLSAEGGLDGDALRHYLSMPDSERQAMAAASLRPTPPALLDGLIQGASGWLG
ncbi:hypothetical protein KIPB_002487 [Kipferlia bialata]|uniref:Uncharacterized protein n=1 Tax=Kipferlia bialata TaxID=797122 RepID=A0A9K3CSB9_9EUKA|nr:hypothetical protein KIPB_002487 [Kipferlia bialata]|eukprot:g2487.t1